MPAHYPMKAKFPHSIPVVLFVLMAFLSNDQSPVIFTDVPDVAMIRMGDTYYMSSTTMHMSPGLPIVKSRDLV
jgi:beta-xylosidase